MMVGGGLDKKVKDLKKLSLYKVGGDKKLMEEREGKISLGCFCLQIIY